MKGDTTYQ